jgi:hypothetical protein
LICPNPLIIRTIPPNPAVPRPARGMAVRKHLGSLRHWSFLPTAGRGEGGEKSRYTRYNVTHQSLSPLHLPLQPATTRYTARKHPSPPRRSDNLQSDNLIIHPLPTLIYLYLPWWGDLTRMRERTREPSPPDSSPNPTINHQRSTKNHSPTLIYLYLPESDSRSADLPGRSNPWTNPPARFRPDSPLPQIPHSAFRNPHSRNLDLPVFA